MSGKVFDLRTEDGRKAFYDYCDEFERDDVHYCRIMTLRIKAQYFYKQHARSIRLNDQDHL